MVSGGFDPLHIGHLRMIKEAAKYGKVIVVVNSDAWLLRKKGFIFMPFEERKEIIEGYAEVDRVEAVDDSDGTVCEALWRVKPTYFANGGDRTSNNTPEMRVCKQLDIEMLCDRHFHCLYILHKTSHGQARQLLLQYLCNQLQWQ